ncbi:hypothetical protein L210DRAFT_3588165 [Boletus edulis BED1]|uniref:Uncharacterized protein n=1 Tax=Boletus edulis BED1 TaxID=1328754 RepID=A0AAD4BAN3_BOLED|nr:hypothetical protein L210DRAFT_3588165 [Boletus edulis BED1]
MILRVYAMYNRSKIILSVLLVMYLTEVVILFVGGGFYSDPNYDKASISQIPDIAVCSIVLTTQTWNIAAATIQCILGTVLCILAVAQLMRNSVQMYQATRVWQLNRYIRILTRDGLFYFLATLFYALTTVLSNTHSRTRQRSGTLLAIAIADVLLYTLTPRFVINVRELYTLDSHAHLNGGIDTGFGLTSRGRRGVGVSTTIGTMAFAEAGATGGLEDGEEMAIMEPDRAVGSSWQARQI